MDYTIIKPKTIYTIELESGPNKNKCEGCNFLITENLLGYKFIDCKIPTCYREFNTETKAREWLDKIEKYESSVDAGLLTVAGENK